MPSTVSESYVLIADDDADDIDMLTTALKEVGSMVHVIVAENGKRVMEELQKDVLRSGTAPCVLVMDMNMPKMDGRETVVAIKGHEHLKNLPILLFSTAKNKTDELFAEKWGVHFVQKPDSVQGLNDVARVILTMCNRVTSTS